jgi:Pectate lyase superfamily protein/Concanavalin A-like lectin/glucanases superfamily
MHKLLSKTFLGSLLALAAIAGTAAAQYQPIPNFTGIGAGFNFRQAINQRLSGATPISPQIIGYLFASLPAEQDGLLAYCKDCMSATACTGGGAGAWAFGQRGQWMCSLGGTANLSAYTGAVGVTGNSGNGSDTISNVNINGSLNVRAYGARGDGTTDDTAAIQAALAASCASPGSNKPVVFLPPTPGRLCYKTTSPLLLNCSTSITGPAASLNGAASICQNYLGPAIIAQAAETSWAPPLASSVALAPSFAPLANVWQASHVYSVQFKEILDSNGNVEFVNTTGTSGSGSHPTWCTTQGCTTTDGTVTWQLAMIGTSLATGPGSALDTVSQEFFSGAGYGNNNGPFELNNSGKLDTYMNGLGAFTIEFYVDVVVGRGSNDVFLVGMEPGQPMPSNLLTFRIALGGAGQGSCTTSNPCPYAYVNIGGVQKLVFNAATATPINLGVTHHVALTYDSSNLRLFWDGALEATTAATGTLTVPAYESFLIPDGGNQCYPGQCSANFGEALAYYDSLRISNSARYTSNFTTPTAKFTSDGNTIFLENFPINAPVGTIQGLNHGQNVFFPIETSNGAADLNPAYIGNLNLSGNGIWATWMVNSTIENINILAGVGGDHETCINLANNDFQDTVRRVFCATGENDGTTRVGFVFGNQSNNNLYDHLQCDGQHSCIGELGGSGHYIMPDFTDRGDAIYLSTVLYSSPGSIGQS